MIKLSLWDLFRFLHFESYQRRSLAPVRYAEKMKISLSNISIHLAEIGNEFHRDIEMLLPILDKLDSTKISDESGLNYDGINVSVSIIPKHYEYAGLNIFIAKDQVVVDFAGGPQYEDHDTNVIDIVLIERIEKYLAGIRTKAYYNKKGRILKMEYFDKNNTKIGTSKYSLFPISWFSKKIEKENSISFFFGLTRRSS